MDFWYYVTLPFALVINFIYNFIPNYGVAIIIFTLLVKALLWPLTAKSQKSMVEMQKLQPEIKKLQEKYKNDKEKLNQETMDLYQKHNVNPAGGCLPMLIQLPLIIAVYQVVSSPLTHMMHYSADTIKKIAEILQVSEKMPQIDMINKITNSGIDFASYGIENFKKINFDFLGLNLAQTPQAVISDWSTNFIWLIPLLSLATAYMMSLTNKSQTTNAPANDQAAQTQKTMMYLMPLMSGYFTFVLPAGVGIYWIVSNVMQTVQQYMINKKLYPTDNKIIDATPKKKK